MQNLSPELAIINGTPRVSSLEISEHFCKPHKHVLESIRKISSECPSEFNEPNFRPVEYADLKGEMRPMYQLSRDGFTLLAMGFAGKKALAWKLKYIEAFNAMDSFISGRKALPRSVSEFEQYQEEVLQHIRAIRKAEEKLYDSLIRKCKPNALRNSPRDVVVTCLRSATDEILYSIERNIGALERSTAALVASSKIQ